jgi:hypothetical protein
MEVAVGAGGHITLNTREKGYRLIRRIQELTIYGITGDKLNPLNIMVICHWMMNGAY